MTETDQPHISSAFDPKTAGAIRRVLWFILALNILVAAGKLIVGIATGMIAMIADGFHGTMDASSNVIGLIGMRLASQPPDEEHPYGHRRFETLATLAIGGLLLMAVWEIVQTTINRLLNGGSPEVKSISFGVMIGTICINLFITTYERRRGRALNSDILVADAMHTATDLYVSTSVLVSLIVTKLGFSWIDVVTALVIVLVIGRTALVIIRQASNTLADRQTLDPQALKQIIQNVPGVKEIVRVRSRGPEEAVYVDVDARIQPATTADHAEAIAQAIRERIQDAYPTVIETQVYFAPHRSSSTDYTLNARAIADTLGLSVHEVIPVAAGDGITLEMHVEVPPGLTLDEAHRQVTDLEHRLQKQNPAVREVLTHIEPAGTPNHIPHPPTPTALALRDEALSIASTLYPNANWHNAAIRRAQHGYTLTMHCHLPASVSVEEAHAIAEHVETKIRGTLLEIQRVTIHTEPPDTEAA